MKSQEQLDQEIDIAIGRVIDYALQASNEEAADHEAHQRHEEWFVGELQRRLSDVDAWRQHEQARLDEHEAEIHRRQERRKEWLEQLNQTVLALESTLQARQQLDAAYREELKDGNVVFLKRDSA